MSYVIDRRLNGKNKSTVNRQRFLRRYREHIKKAVEEAVSRLGETVDAMEASRPAPDLTVPPLAGPAHAIDPSPFRAGFERTAAPHLYHAMLDAADYVPKPDSDGLRAFPPRVIGRRCSGRPPRQGPVRGTAGHSPACRADRSARPRPLPWDRRRRRDAPGGGHAAPQAAAARKSR